MENINYFLVEANRLKVNSYAFVKKDFVVNLFNFLYDGYDSKELRRIESRYENMLSAYDSVIDLYDFSVLCIKRNLESNIKYISSTDSTLLRTIYLKGRVLKEYKELSFVMFMLGMVDMEDYFKYCTDLSYFGSKFYITRVKNTHSVSKGYISISIKYYSMFIGYFFKNSLNGVNYGCHPLDFLSVMLKYDYSDTLSKYRNIIKMLRDIGIDSEMCSGIELSNEILEKYHNELGILVALMGSELSKECVVDILSRCDIYLQDAVLNDVNYILSIGTPGVDYIM